MFGIEAHFFLLMSYICVSICCRPPSPFQFQVVFVDNFSAKTMFTSTRYSVSFDLIAFYHFATNSNSFINFSCYSMFSVFFGFSGCKFRFPSLSLSSFPFSSIFSIWYSHSQMTEFY